MENTFDIIKFEKYLDASYREINLMYYQEFSYGAKSGYFDRRCLQRHMYGFIYNQVCAILVCLGHNNPDKGHAETIKIFERDFIKSGYYKKVADIKPSTQYIRRALHYRNADVYAEKEKTIDCEINKISMLASLLDHITRKMQISFVLDCREKGIPYPAERKVSIDVPTHSKLGVKVNLFDMVTIPSVTTNFLLGYEQPIKTAREAIQESKLYSDSIKQWVSAN